jgi:hypothetical protein
MTQDAFENMISGCPLLEKLTLTKIDGVTQINIHAPNLKDFEIYDEFESINFDHTFQLAMVSVILISKSNQIGLHGCSNNLLKFFVHLPHIYSIFICEDFLKVSILLMLNYYFFKISQFIKRRASARSTTNSRTEKKNSIQRLPTYQKNPKRTACDQPEP